jgi:hypothetical protein
MGFSFNLEALSKLLHKLCKHLGWSTTIPSIRFSSGVGAQGERAASHCIERLDGQLVELQSLALCIE